MQKIILSFMLLVFSAAKAQLKQGVIIYERKVNMHKNIPKEDESMKNLIAEFSTSKLKMIFSGNESVSMNMETEPDIIESTGDAENNRIKIRIDAPEIETYKNFQSGKTIQQRSLGPRKYIIEEAMPQHKWQLKEETKIIQGYNCKKAVTKNPDNKEVIAWYTESINAPSGPEHWGGLPGMILGLEMDDATVVYTAISIEPELGNQVVKTPSGGKKISRQEFDKMMQERMGPEEKSGRIIIRRLEQ